ncbi:MAG: helix-turn-helix domain-containing protein [Armatimonadia bacterium]|nr:helix-turn-helix domain-containing protein [Armatimonadia bacterium]
MASHLTVTEVAEALQLSTATVKRYIYDGRITSVKLPGGQHRIPVGEVERLLHAADEDAPEPQPERPAEGEDLAARVEVLERWASEQEAEIERLSASLQVLAAYARQIHAGDTPGAAEHEPMLPRILVLGPGCRRCQALYDNATRALRALGQTADCLGKVTDLAAIAQYGPVLTPALVIDGEVIVSGRVPSEASLRDTLAPRFG